MVGKVFLYFASCHSPHMEKMARSQGKKALLLAQREERLEVFWEVTSATQQGEEQLAVQ